MENLRSLDASIVITTCVATVIGLPDTVFLWAYRVGECDRCTVVMTRTVREQ